MGRSHLSPPLTVRSNSYKGQWKLLAKWMWKSFGSLWVNFLLLSILALLILRAGWNNQCVIPGHMSKHKHMQSTARGLNKLENLTLTKSLSSDCFFVLVVFLSFISSCTRLITKIIPKPNKVCFCQSLSEHGIERQENRPEQIRSQHALVQIISS